VHFKRWHDSEAIKRLDVIVFSNEDIVEAPDMEADIAREARHLFVTQAEQGGIHYDHGQVKRYTTPQVEVVHPTGAGDVFATSLLCAWYRLKDWDAAAQVAAHLAAVSVTRVGLDSAPTPEEVTAAFKEVSGGD
jgi:sugar/nucleoside kinase (ribokinase family)